jgi:hypothetical protein
MEIKFAIEALENNYWSIQQHQVILMPLIPKDKWVIWICTITIFQSWRYTTTIHLFWNIPLQFFDSHKNAMEYVW